MRDPRKAGGADPAGRAAEALHRVQDGAQTGGSPPIVGPGRKGRPGKRTGTRLLSVPRPGMRAKGAQGRPDRPRPQRNFRGTGAYSAPRLVESRLGLTLSETAD